jgi:hypothetical protein
MAENDTSRRRVRMDVTTESAQRFLELLSEDDAFRTGLAQNPRSVLAEYGVDVSPELVPAQVKIPSKRKLRLLKLLLKRQADLLFWWPFLLGRAPRRS